MDLPFEPRLLRQVDGPRTERRDAASNREAILAAAHELLRTTDVDSVTMDAVARLAGVGKGTLFRRFGSREGLMAELLDHAERRWQGAVISGPPPLGPGADPLERLLAFGASRIEHNLTQGALIAAAGNPGGRSFAALSFTTMHVRYLLTELGVTGDLAYLATALVAPLEFMVLRQQVAHEHVPLDRIVAGWTDLVHRVVGAPATGVR